MCGCMLLPLAVIKLSMPAMSFRSQQNNVFKLFNIRFCDYFSVAYCLKMLVRKFHLLLSESFMAILLCASRWQYR